MRLLIVCALTYACAAHARLLLAPVAKATSSSALTSTTTLLTEENVTSTEFDYFKLHSQSEDSDSTTIETPSEVVSSSSLTIGFTSFQENTAKETPSPLGHVLDTLVDLVGVGLFDTPSLTNGVSEISVDVQHKDASDVYTLRLFHD